MKIKITWNKDKFKSDMDTNADNIKSHWFDHVVNWVLVGIILVIAYWQTPIGAVLPRSTVTVGDWVALIWIYSSIYFGTMVLLDYVFGYIALLYRWIKKRGE